jgi:hypoxanthine phosphoribosyltransferase
VTAFREDRLKPYLTAERIAALNAELGARISADYEKVLDPNEQVLVVVTLKGAMFFAADVLRHFRFPVAIDFVRLASYGGGTKSSGNVRVLKDVETSPEGRHVLVLDEIVDSGRTLQFLGNRLREQNPKSLRIAALLDKPSRREVSVSVDYLGATVEDKFLVGYGLDYGEKYRNSKDILYLES